MFPKWIMPEIQARWSTGVLTLLLLAALWGFLFASPAITLGWTLTIGWAGTALLPFAMRLARIALDPDESPTYQRTISGD